MPTSKKITVICHGDVDGLIAAAVAMGHYGVYFPRLVITQPFMLDKIGQIDGQVVVVDIAVNNRDTAMTAKFIAEHDVLAWYDHHDGGAFLTDLLGERAIVGDFPSCPALMRAHGIRIEDWLVDAANAADRPMDFPATKFSDLFNQAIKVALVEQTEGKKGFLQTVQEDMVAGIESGVGDWPLVRDCASRYPTLLTATKAAAEGFATMADYGDMKIVATTLQEGALVDKTQLFMLGYKTAKVVVLRYKAQDGREVSTIATSDKALNLVEKFGLPSGAAFRITLTEGDWFAQVEQIKAALVGRLCQCGSGEPWVTCHKADKNCG